MMTKNIKQKSQIKVDFIYEFLNRNERRKIAKISTGQYLIMEKTNRLEDFVKEKINKMDDEEINILYKKSVKAAKL